MDLYNMSIPPKCKTEGCDGYVSDRRYDICNYCLAIVNNIKSAHKKVLEEEKNRSSGSAMQQRVNTFHMEMENNVDFSLTPSYYGGGKIIDPYKYATLHKLSPACAHAIKYITRTGKKDSNTYQEDIINAINALRRDLEIYEELNPKQK